MKKAEKYLKLAIYIELCLFVGMCLYRYMDYRLHPLDYVIQSAPWYVGCIVYLVDTLIAVTITAIAYFIVKHKNKTAK